AGRALLASAALCNRPVRALPADTGAGHLDETARIDPWAWVLHHVPVGPDGRRFWHEFGASVARPLIGATCFESDSLPASWVQACREVEAVWVPGEFNLRTFADAGVDPARLRIVPYPVDTDLLCPAPARARSGPFTFLSVFEWTWRKGWDALLTAYCTEFAAGEDVRLRILTYRGSGTHGALDIPAVASQHIASLGLDPDAVADIELLLAPVDDAGLVELYRDADAFVLATRGEGAGMPVVEAMACGTPVVATAFGGHADLMTPDLAYPVEVERMVPASPELIRDNALYIGQRLADPSVDSLRAQMRAVVDDPDGAAARAAAARRAVVDTRSIAAAARALDAAIGEIVDEVHP
ncbi:MAG: glycosyltransferase, partial [Actinomycetota bacterium]